MQINQSPFSPGGLKLFLPCLLFLVSPALGAEGSKKYVVEDYRSLWGINGKTTRQEILSRFGKPERIFGTNPGQYYYFADTLSFFFSKSDTVATVVIDANHNDISPNSIPSEIIDKAFIGKHRDDVIREFGTPDDVSSDYYRYNSKSGSFFRVMFQCYDFDKFICKQIWLAF